LLGDREVEGAMRDGDALTVGIEEAELVGGEATGRRHGGGGKRFERNRGWISGLLQWSRWHGTAAITIPFCL
jgi:hypothetical protein